jgi:hypothetical protein
MASDKQVVANRANAKRSTGPKTAAGKALSRMNAYKHGLTAETIVIGDEDPKAFDLLRAELEEERGEEGNTLREHRPGLPRQPRHPWDSVPIRSGIQEWGRPNLAPAAFPARSESSRE